MNKKLSELSKPVGFVSDRASTQLKEGDPASIRPFFDVQGSKPLYSQEYVSALLSQIEADREIKARLCRESNRLHDGLKAAEKRIAELEAKLATPVRLSDTTHPRCRQQHAEDIRAAGFAVEGDE